MTSVIKYRGGGIRKVNGKKTVENLDLDEIDRKIIELMAMNPERTQNDVASHVGLTQSTIALRVLKLKERSLMLEQIGLNFQILGMQMCRLDVETEDEETVLGWARRCPLFINASNSLGGGALSLFFAAEDSNTFHEIISAHLRKLPARITNFSMIQSWEKPLSLQFNLDNKDRSKPPCNIGPYCSKCPVNPKYTGRIWNGGHYSNGNGRKS